MEKRKGSVTVKAEDRPSGLAGDSASVITLLFRLQPGLVEWRVLVAAARSGAALVSRQAHATVANYFLKSGLRDNRSLIYYDKSAIITL